MIRMDVLHDTGICIRNLRESSYHWLCLSWHSVEYQRHNISDCDWDWRFGWMFPIIRRDVAVVLTQTGAVYFWCHRLSLFLWHNIFVHLFEDLLIITHCELNYQDFVRMSVLINGPLWEEFTRHEWIPHTDKASNTDHWLFTPQSSGL